MAMLGRLLPASNLRTPWEAIAGPRTPFSASELGLRFYILENMQMKWRLDSAVLLVVARFFSDQGRGSSDWRMDLDPEQSGLMRVIQSGQNSCHSISVRVVVGQDKRARPA